MPNLSDFLKCEKVRCVSSEVVDLTNGEKYEITNIRIEVKADDGEKWLYPWSFFEPVTETAIQATDNLDDTPMGTRTVNEFEVGNRVYIIDKEHIGKIYQIRDFVNNGKSISTTADDFYVFGELQVRHATLENYEMLCKLYPHIKFEKPPVLLQGSDLCRAMLDKGWKYVLCYVDDYSEKIEDLFFRAITKYDKDSFYCEQDGRWTYAVPFDPKTGKPLTSEVLDD